jgi:hypothetical protein
MCKIYEKNNRKRKEEKEAKEKIYSKEEYKG